MAVASAPVASAAPRLPTSHRDASVADARPQTCAAAHGAKCRSISKVGEFAFSRKVAALEVAQNYMMSNSHRYDFERRCDLIAVPLPAGHDRQPDHADRDQQGEVPR